jgi:RNA polymerase-binding transcription factor DksA
MHKDEKERRKQILNELRKKQQQEFEEGLPMDKEVFKNLFEDLDNQLEEKGCDHTTTLTLQFLENNKISKIENVLQWLAGNGGHCDCEILANVEEKFESYGKI